MADQKITDLTNLTAMAADYYLELGRSSGSVARKFLGTLLVTTNTAATITADHVWDDNAIIKLGAGVNGQLYSDGTNVIYKLASNQLKFQDGATLIWTFNPSGIELADDKYVNLGDNEALTMRYDSGNTRVEFHLSSMEGPLVFQNSDEDVVMQIEATAAGTVTINKTLELTDSFTFNVGVTNGYVLTTNGSGEASWQAGGGGSGYWTQDGSDIYYTTGNIETSINNKIILDRATDTDYIVSNGTYMSFFTEATSSSGFLFKGSDGKKWLNILTADAGSAGYIKMYYKDVEVIDITDDGMEITGGLSIGIAPNANFDIIAGTTGAIQFVERSGTPTATTNYGSIYTKSASNVLYFQDGDGTEHTVDIDGGGGGSFVGLTVNSTVTSAWTTWNDDQYIYIGTGKDFEIAHTSGNTVFHLPGSGVGSLLFQDTAATYAIFNGGGIEMQNDKALQLGDNDALTMVYDSTQTRVEFELSSGEGNLCFMNTDSDVIFSVQASAGGKCGVESAVKFYFDGLSGNTYVSESTADTLSFFVGGQEVARMKEASNIAALYLDEITTPGTVAGYGAIYPKSDDKLYFKDSGGTEHEIAFEAAP